MHKRESLAKDLVEDNDMHKRESLAKDLVEDNDMHKRESLAKDLVEDIIANKNYVSDRIRTRRNDQNGICVPDTECNEVNYNDGSTDACSDKLTRTQRRNKAKRTFCYYLKNPSNMRLTEELQTCEV
jgi:hypothetical protein